MEAVVKLELLLEAEGLLIEEGIAYASRSAQGRGSRDACTGTSGDV
jgi:hypothetical protein